jgi:phosphatidylglycerol:prolipoprotein diacylglycerol transferase
MYDPLMHPILFEIRGFSLHTYGAVYLLAFLAAIGVAWTLGRRDGLLFWKMVDVASMIAIAGEVGARLTFVIVEWDRISAGQIGFRQPASAGRVVLGGVVVGILFAAWIFRRHALAVAGLLDAVLTGAALGMGIGRVACLKLDGLLLSG